MAERALDPIVLGHNGFFGVDHLSAARGAERAAQFADPARIVDVIRVAREHGAGGMMMSTHERAAGVAAELSRDRVLRADFRVYPLLPYVQKYVVAANEVGMVNAVTSALAGTSAFEKLTLAWQGAVGVVATDLDAILGPMIEIELRPFRALDVPAVFLHDVFTDLALALELRGVFEFFLDEIPRKHRATAAFATKNLPTFLARFAAWGFDPPTVMTPFNKVGYQMNPDREACERALAQHEARVMAMASLASGFLRPPEAYAYLGAFPAIRSVVVGTSSTAHVEETFGCIRGHLGHAG